MAKSMTKTQVYAALAEKTGLSKADARNAIDSLVQLSYENAADGFTIPGLGKLILVDRAARMARNPATGEPVHVPAKRVLKFRIAKAAKDATM